MFSYFRKVFYHETDKMAIVHHSNYLKWMEEARVAFLEDIGMPFEEVEARGIGSPVVEINVKYKKPAAFGDEVRVDIEITKFNGIKFEVDYTISNVKTNEVLTTAHSAHCFLKNGVICSIKNEAPDYFEKLMATVK